MSPQVRYNICTVLELFVLLSSLLGVLLFMPLLWEGRMGASESFFVAGLLLLILCAGVLSRFLAPLSKVLNTEIDGKRVRIVVYPQLGFYIYHLGFGEGWREVRRQKGSITATYMFAALSDCLPVAVDVLPDEREIWNELFAGDLAHPPSKAVISRL